MRPRRIASAWSSLRAPATIRAPPSRYGRRWASSEAASRPSGCRRILLTKAELETFKTTRSGSFLSTRRHAGAKGDEGAIRYNFPLGSEPNDRAHALRPAVGVAHRARRGRRHDAPLYRPPPRARSHEPPGVRRHEARAPQTLARLRDPRGGRSQRSDDRPLRRNRRPRVAPASRYARQELRGIRHRRIQDERRSPGHRARHRPGAGRDTARNDGGMRRLTNRPPRTVRLPRVRNPDLGGRTCPFNAVPAREEDEKHARAHR